MKLVFPTIAYKERAIGYINEFYEYGSEINGSGSLDRFLKESSYEAWLEKLLRDMDLANIPESRVPGLTYFYVREADEAIVGMINIRLALNEFLRREGGHIGYSIRPTERRKHYGTQMLAAALKVCDLIGIEEVLISCDKDNPASAGVIQNCGGILKSEAYSETFHEVLQMYAIQRMKPIFQSERIQFVNLSEHLIPAYLTMMNDYENVNRFTSKKGKHFTEEDEIEWVRSKLTEQAVIFSMLDHTGAFIGNTELMPVSDSVRELGITITAEKQNQGYGTEAVTALVNFGMEHLGLQKVLLRVKLENKRALHVYQSCGFREYDRNNEHIFMEHSR